MEGEIRDICRALFDGLGTHITFEPIGSVEAAGFCNPVVPGCQHDSWLGVHPQSESLGSEMAREDDEPMVFLPAESDHVVFPPARVVVT